MRMIFHEMSPSGICCVDGREATYRLTLVLDYTDADGRWQTEEMYCIRIGEDGAALFATAEEYDLSCDEDEEYDENEEYELLPLDYADGPTPRADDEYDEEDEDEDGDTLDLERS